MQEVAKLLIPREESDCLYEYVILEDQVLGRGAFGVVKKAYRWDQLNHNLAVKIIPYSSKNKIRFEKEIKVLQNLPKNINVVEVEPYKCYSSNNFYIFMEYCNGGSLQNLIKNRQKFTDTEIFNIFYQIMNGYRALWETKILHQDLKPENILIHNNVLKICDFGLSILEENSNTSNEKCGTLLYMPLQKFKVDNYKPNSKCDVYAIGVIIFTLITGHHPYVTREHQNVKALIQEIQATSIQSKLIGFNNKQKEFQELFNIVIKMVDKDESVRMSFDEIYQYIASQPIYQEIENQLNKSHHPNPQQASFFWDSYEIKHQSEILSIKFDTKPTLPLNSQNPKIFHLIHLLHLEKHKKQEEYKIQTKLLKNNADQDQGTCRHQTCYDQLDTELQSKQYKYRNSQNSPQINGINIETNTINPKNHSCHQKIEQQQQFPEIIIKCLNGKLSKQFSDFILSSEGRRRARHFCQVIE